MDSHDQTNFNAIMLTKENENRLILVAGRRYLHEYGLRVLRMVVGSGDYLLPPFTIQDQISEDTMQMIRENVSYVVERSYQSTSIEDSSISLENSSSTSLKNTSSEGSGISYDSLPLDDNGALPESIPITLSPTNQTDQTFSCRSIDVCQVVHCTEPPKIPMKMEHKSLGFEVVRTKRKTGMNKYMKKLEDNQKNSENRKMENSFLTYQDYVQALNEEKIARKQKLGHIIETEHSHLRQLNKALDEIDENASCSQTLSPTSKTIEMKGRRSAERRCKQSVIWVRNGEEKWVKEAKQQVFSWVDGLNTATFFPFIPSPGENLEEIESPNSIVLGDAGLSRSLSASSADMSHNPSFKYKNTSMSSDVSFDSALGGDDDPLMGEINVRQIPSQCSKPPLELSGVENRINQGTIRTSFSRQKSSRAQLRKQAQQILNINNGDNLSIRTMKGGNSDETEIAFNTPLKNLYKKEVNMQLATEDIGNDGHIDCATSTEGVIRIVEVTRKKQDINSIDNIEQRNAPESCSIQSSEEEARCDLNDSIEQSNAPKSCAVQPRKHQVRCGLSDSGESSTLERIATIDISRSVDECQSLAMVDKGDAIGTKEYFHCRKPRKTEATLLQTTSHISYANSSICTTSIHCDSIDDIIITFSSASDSEMVSSSATSEEVYCNSVNDENIMVSHLPQHPHAHPSSFSFE